MNFQEGESSIPDPKSSSKRRRSRRPNPESESPDSGFHVRVDTPNLLFDAIQAGVSGQIGKILLEKPITEVEVKVQSDLETFNYLAEIDPDYGLSIGRASVIDISTTKVLNRFGVPTERGGNHFITAPNGTNILVSRTGITHGMTITTGLLQSSYSYEETIQLLSPPRIIEEDFQAATKDFTEFLEALVREIYAQTGKSSPSETLVIKSPKQLLGERGSSRYSDLNTPQSLIGKIEIERPSVTFEEIGGQPDAKREIEGLAFALSNPDLYHKWGTKPPKGIILYGSPGTGKTLVARALASQAHARFFHVEASDISSKWYGESEEIVKQIFELANSSNEKTIVFFDEIDAVAPPRTGAHEATQRVLATMLESMDGIVSKENVVVVASTNRLDSVEPALLRAGRFDRWVEVPLPDLEGRRQIFEIHMRKAEALAQRALFNHVDLNEVVAKTDKSSGADIAEVIRRSLEEKVREEGASGNEPGVVTTEELLREINRYEKTRETKRSLGFSTQPQQTLNLDSSL